MNLVETKLYVTNLPDSCDQAELKSLFEKHGKVLECVIMWNHYAFVHFESFQEAKIALDNLDGELFEGKRLIVQLSTSSNRPLPKCVVFSNKQNKSDESPSDMSPKPRSNKENTSPAPKRLTENLFANLTNVEASPDIRTSILCYQASDLEKNEFGVKRAEEIEAKKEKKLDNINWIQAISSGNLPVVTKPQPGTWISINDLFSSVKPTTQLSLSEIPTPQMPDLAVKFPSAKNPKKLTDLIENTLIKVDKVTLDEVPTPPMPKFDEEIKDQSDCLKKLIENINSSMTKEKPEEVLDETKLKNLWETNSNNIRSKQSSYTSSMSTSRTSSESSASISPTNEPFTIDYINSKCVYEENVIQIENEVNLEPRVQHSPVPIVQFQRLAGAPLSRQTPTRCRVVNYILFPELREQYFSSKKDYEKALVDMVNTNCVFDAHNSK